jgi:hypothetical protein
MKRAEESAEQLIWDQKQAKSTIPGLYQDRPVAIASWSQNSMAPNEGALRAQKAIKGSFQTLTVPATVNGLRGLL